MIHPRVLFIGSPAAATPWVGIAKKLARACYDLKIVSKVYQLGSSVKIRVENIFPIAGKLGGICKVWIEAGVVKIHGFVFHPHSDSAPNGWWFPDEDAEERKVRDTIYYINGDINALYRRPHALYKVKTSNDNIFKRDLSLFAGNQVFYKDNICWSWWHSPLGDGPIPGVGFGSLSKKCLRTPYYRVFGNAFYLCYNYESASGGLELYELLYSLIYKDGKVFWSSSPSFSAIIGGMYPVSEERLLVVLVEALTTANIYDSKYDPLTETWTNTLILTLTVPDNFTYTTPRNIPAVRWPWRFNSDGTRCATIIENASLLYPEYGQSYGVFYSYEIWTLSITYDEESDSYTATRISNPSYTARREETRSSSLIYTMYSAFIQATRTYDLEISSSVESGYEKLPYGVTYKDNEQIIAWMDFSDSVSQGETNEYTFFSPPPDNDIGEATSVYSYTVTYKRSIQIGAKILELEDHTIIQSSDDSYSVDGVAVSGTIDSSETRTGKGNYLGLLYLDIKNEFVVACYGYTVRTSDSTGGYFEGDTDDTVSIPSNRNYISSKNIKMILAKEVGVEVEEVDLVNTTQSSYIVTSVNIEISDLWFKYFYWEAADEFYNNVINYYYYDLLPTDRQIAYGMLVNETGDYVISFDWPEYKETVPAVTLLRETGNFSNIPNFDSDVVNTISGDNVLLFPIGLM